MRVFTASGVIVMAMVGAEIERLIKTAFPDAQVVVVDLAGDGDHFAARVSCAEFKGKSRVQQHTMVYDALQGHMGGALHALAIETIVPK
jgi:stress-induced morphogen